MAATLHPLFDSDALRRLEREALASLPPHTLMTRAGAAACALALARWPGRPVYVLCGPGNNGGDGLVMARLLHEAGVAVRVWAQPAGRRPEDAARAWDALPADLLAEGALPEDAGRALIVDAVFGIGLTRPLDAATRAWLAWANRQADAARLAIDVPTGLDGDTGRAQEDSFVADVTLTFLRDKPGLHTHAGKDKAGEVLLDTLGVEQPAAQITDAHVGRLIRRADVPALFTKRQQDTHKGSFGTLAVLGGGRGMTGAALLAGRAALHLGAGKVFLAFPTDQPDLPCDPLQPELMLRPAAGLLAQSGAGVETWVMGCGLGTDDDALRALRDALRAAREHEVVLDADGLLLLAAHPEIAGGRRAPWVLTPHPREAARLLDCDTADIQADRIGQARRLAARHDAWVVLKGAGTVVAAPDGDWSINASGNPGLATAGTGDVLAGMIGALLAQGLAPADAVRGGVWLHGAAADLLVERGVGPVGLTAGEVYGAARTLRNAPQGA